MATKKETGLKSTLTLGKKKPIAKKDKGLRLDATKVDTAVQAIHKKEARQKFTRVSIDIPNDRYKEMKIKVVTEGSTVRKYFLDLLEKDLG